MDINQLLSGSPFITICLRAISFSVEDLYLIIFTNVVSAFYATLRQGANCLTRLKKWN